MSAEHDPGPPPGALGLGLLLAWNSAHIQHVVDEVRAGGELVTADDLERISPLARQHIHLHGDCRSRRPTRWPPAPQNRRGRGDDDNASPRSAPASLSTTVANAGHVSTGSVPSSPRRYVPSLADIRARTFSVYHSARGRRQAGLGGTLTVP
ncbi:MAG TPA: Tn3 family transposase [Solirubrobacteraceae bacterium]|nr:Tn3 family transposase [Solirubrobacteraceae bacterium]